MERKDNLTNEKIKKRFDNQFDLVNYAIGIAKDMINAGRAPRIKTQTENPALLVLEEILAGKDLIQDKDFSSHGYKTPVAGIEPAPEHQIFHGKPAQEKEILMK